MDRFLKRVLWLIIIAPAIYLALVWNKLPETIAMKFNLKGDVTRYGSKKELIMLTALMIFVSIVSYLIITNIYRIDPKKYAADNKTRLHRMGFAICLFLAAIVCMIIYNSTRGNVKPNIGLILAGVGLLLSFVGNYMHNLKPNYFAGIRLPWTLENEDNWRKTHALAGKLWFGGGLFIASICALLPSEASLIVFFTLLFTMILIPCIYSYLLYRKQKETVNH